MNKLLSLLVALMLAVSLPILAGSAQNTELQFSA